MPHKSPFKLRLRFADALSNESHFSPDLQAIFGPSPRVLFRVPGSALSGLRYRHPLSRYLEEDGGADRPVLAANHVTLTAGTGLVHTAPAHGQVVLCQRSLIKGT